MDDDEVEDFLRRVLVINDRDLIYDAEFKYRTWDVSMSDAEPWDAVFRYRVVADELHRRGLRIPE